MKTYAVYIMASQKHGTLYIGVTNNIARRASEHRDGEGSEFTKRYGVNRLVYIEYFEQIHDAIAREKQLKNWKREWKIELIEKMNPDWVDLYLKLNH